MSDTNKQKVQFWRGKTLKTNPDDNNSTNGEIIFLNNTMGETSAPVGTTPDAWNIDKKLGSIYQDDKIVGTTKADELITTKSITIAGGPLADDLGSDSDWPSEWKESGKKVIPRGASLQSILEKLFLKEIYPTTTSTPASYSLSVGKPSSSLTVTDNTVEVGTAVSLNNVTISSGTSASSTSPKVTGFTYGYKDAQDDVNVTNVSEISGSVSTSLNTDSNYSLSISISDGFVATASSTGNTATLTTSTASKAAGTDGKGWQSLSIAKQSLGYVKEGTNKLTIKSTGATYTFTPSEVGQKFIVSNIGNTDANKKSDATNSSGVSQPSAPTNTLELSVTGARYMFWGAYETRPTTMDSTEIRKHTGGGSVATGAITETIDLTGKTYVFVALPSGRTLNNLYNQLGADLGSVMASVTSSTVNVNGANGYTEAQYKLYVFESSSKLNGNYTIVIK